MKQKVQGLKKEFRKKDVNRMRNLITGKVDAATGTQLGYNKKQIEYKEGDIWTEKKKTWTIKNGIKQTISKLDKFKKEVFMPLCCPECGNVMKKHLDKSCYKTHKICLDCVVENKRNLMNDSSEGHLVKYNKHTKTNKIKSNIDRVNDMEAAYIVKINESNQNFISEQGDIERWVGGVDKEALIKEVKDTAKEIRKKLNKELEDL